MEKLNVSFFIKDAKEKLEGKDTTRMAAIHTGAIVALGLLLTVIQLMLSEGMGKASGLSGLGTISMLQTVQTVLQYANTLLVPFWNLGFLYVALQWARGNTASQRDLLTGFHRVGPCIGLLLNRLILMLCVVFLCASLCSTAYLMTPPGQQLQEVMLSMGTAGDYATYMSSLSEENLAVLMDAMKPVLILCCGLSGLLLIPLLYRLRLAEYVILDHKEARAFPAMLISASLLRRRCWQFFKLDLRLWWYHGLKLLCMAVCYGDVLLGALGVSLPVDKDLAYILSYLLYLVLLFGVEVCFRPQVEAAYARAYDALKEMGPVPRKTVTAVPEKMPWSET